MWPPFRHRGRDPVLAGRPEPKSGVVAGIAEEDHERLVEGVGCAEYGMHQCVADAASLVVGMHAERPERECRSRADPCPAAQDVPYHAGGVDRHERERR